MSAFKLCHGLCHASQGISHKTEVEGSSTTKTPVESMVLKIRAIVARIINGSWWERDSKTDSHFSLNKKIHGEIVYKREYKQLIFENKTQPEVCTD